MAESPCTIGEGIQIRGNLSGSGDLVVRGHVAGHIVLAAHLTVAESGTVVADVSTEGMTVNGSMRGDIDARKSVAVTASATMEGDISAPEIEIEDGARFCGRLKMDVPLPDNI